MQFIALSDTASVVGRRVAHRRPPLDRYDQEKLEGAPCDSCSSMTIGAFVQQSIAACRCCSYANCIIELFLGYVSRMQLVTILVSIVKIAIILLPQESLLVVEHEEICVGKYVSQ